MSNTPTPLSREELKNTVLHEMAHLIAEYAQLTADDIMVLVDSFLKAFADEVRDEVIGEDWGTEGLAGDSDLYMKRMCVNGRLYEQRKSLNNLIDKWIGGEDENLGD